MEADADSGHSTATDLADWLVRELKMPFRDAHHATGTLVKIADEKKIKLHQLSLSEMQSAAPGITDSFYKILNVVDAVNSRNSIGGTAPERVLASVYEARKRFLSE